MELYFAPLEGLGASTYRNTHKEFFPGCDAYFAPFITPSDIERVSIRSFRDVYPDKNPGQNLKIQVLTNKSESFLKFAEKAKTLGYDEINLNLGCPSGTVIKKGRGSGFLREPDALDAFFYEVFSKTDVKVTVKTRTGFYSGKEMEKLMEIYNKYPISLLIIHPRAREDYYNGEPDMEVFKAAYESSENPVCYNGNVFSVSDYQRIISEFPKLHSVMLGRGAVKNPAIFREIKGGKPLETKERIAFTKALAAKYYEILKSESYTVNKLKEIWIYNMWDFPEEKKVLKAIKKSKTINDFINAINGLPH